MRILIIALLLTGCSTAPVEYDLVKHETLQSFVESLDPINRHRYQHCMDGIDEDEVCPGASTRIIANKPRIDIWVDTPIGYFCALAHEEDHIGEKDGRYYLDRWHGSEVNDDCGREG